MLSVLKIALITALATTIALAAKGSQNHDPPEDPKCPPHFYPGYQTDVYYFNGPADSFINKMKDFFDIKWYANTTISHTTGRDNMPGATRAGSFGESGYKETLLYYDLIPTGLFMKFISHHKNVANGIPQKPNEQILITFYAEEFSVESFCSGTVTQIEFRVNFCANDPTAASGLWSKLREVAMYGLSVELGVLPIPPNYCPRNAY